MQPTSACIGAADRFDHSDSAATPSVASPGESSLRRRRLRLRMRVNVDAFGPKWLSRESQMNNQLLLNKVGNMFGGEGKASLGVQ